MMAPKLTWRILDLQTVRIADSFARAKAGNNFADRMAIMAIAIRISISVKALRMAETRWFNS